MRLFLTTLALVTLPEATMAQAPSADWRTVETKHFRIHYPSQYEAWSVRAASRIESIRDAVASEVGYAPATITDVVVMNPIADANGVAWPFLDSPRIILYTEPPGPEEQIGESNSWMELLTAHEITHVLHITRPSRNPLERALGSFLSLGPIALRAPRWVHEGYATVVEGRLTGSGRPSSSIRAAILRKWARSGRLPSYGQLDSDRRFLGMSMAYLMGSAFLEWLDARHGPDSFRHLWARMTARQRRSFDSAFSGVYGDSPQKLYGRFIAELTDRAMTIDAAESAQLREGELWQETTRGSGDPSVSPDGKEIVVVERRANKPARLVIWSTGVSEEEAKFDQRIRKMLERDPQDVAPVRTRPVGRKPRHTFTAPDGGDLLTPRWMPDGRSILFAHRQPDARGFLHFDLFLWRFDGRAARLTHLADVSDADPFPDGQRAVAVRNRFGFSQLVEVSLMTGEIRALTEPSLDRVCSHPRVSRNGKQIAFAAHELGAWRIHVLDESGGETVVPLDERANAATPEWSRTNDDIFATVLWRGFIDIHRFTGRTTDNGQRTTFPVTRTTGGAFHPAPSPDGRLFFMALETDGFVVRVLPEIRDLPPIAPFDGLLVPAVPLTAATPATFRTGEVGPLRPYGIGRQEWSWFVGGQWGRSERHAEFGVRLGDVVGRLNTLLVGSLASDGDSRGFALASAWRGSPATLAAHLFHRGGSHSTSGVEFRGDWSRVGTLQTVSANGGGLAGEDEDAVRRLVFAGTSVDARQRRGAIRFQEGIDLSGQAGTSDGDRWSLLRVRGEGSIDFGSLRLTGEATHARVSGGDFSVGGVRSSILPAALLSNRMLDPSLPVGALRGDRYDGWRLAAGSGAATFFYRQHRINRTIGVVGIEVVLRSGPNPILKLPGLEFTAGLARVLDEPLGDRTSGWAGLRWQP